MKQSTKTALCTGLAAATTAVGVAMAAAAALERGGPGLDRALVTALAVVLALGAHMLPALARRQPLAWLLWLGCVVATLYGHAHFFAASSLRAGELRAQAVVQTGQMRAWQDELAAIQARPLAAVAQDQARQNARADQADAAAQRCERSTPGQCSSLGLAAASARARAEATGVELAEARRASALRERLSAAAAAHDAQRAEAGQDPVDRHLAQLTGLPVAAFGLLSSLGQSLLVELLAATLWLLAMARPTAGGDFSAEDSAPNRALTSPPERGPAQAAHLVSTRAPVPASSPDVAAASTARVSSAAPTPVATRPVSAPPAAQATLVPAMAPAGALARAAQRGTHAVMTVPVERAPVEREPVEPLPGKPEPLVPAPVDAPAQRAVAEPTWADSQSLLFDDTGAALFDDRVVRHGSGSRSTQRLARVQRAQAAAAAGAPAGASAPRPVERPLPAALFHPLAPGAV